MNQAQDHRRLTASPHEWLDVMHAPVYIARLPQKVQDAELRAYLTAVEEFFLRHEGKYSLVTDASFVQSATATQRRIVADSDIRLREHDRKWCAGAGIVAKSALMRGAITAIYWMSPPVYPYRVFSNLTEAVVWCRSLFETPTGRPRSLKPAP